MIGHAKRVPPQDMMPKSAKRFSDDIMSQLFESITFTDLDGEDPNPS
jgi:hypothetical protein